MAASLYITTELPPTRDSVMAADNFDIALGSKGPEATGMIVARDLLNDRMVEERDIVVASGRIFGEKRSQTTDMTLYLGGVDKAISIMRGQS